MRMLKDQKRKMGCAVVAYVIVLAIDLLVGTSLIVWKCGLANDEAECKLAVGGTAGSVGIWLLLLLVCPFCVIKCDIHDTLDKGREKCKRVLHKIRPPKERSIYIESEIYLPTTLSLKGKRHTMTFDDATRQYSNSSKPTQRLTTSDDDAMAFKPDVVYTFNEANCAIGRSRLAKYLAPDAPNT